MHGKIQLSYLLITEKIQGIENAEAAADKIEKGY